MKASKIFITGATGFIGRQLVKQILLNNRPAEMYLLIRNSGKKTAAIRFQNLLENLSEETNVSIQQLASEIHLIEGNLQSVRFGCPVPAYKMLAQKIDTIFHLAASVQLHGSLQSLRNSNLIGTQQVLNFAYESDRLGGFELLHYLSTAYVAGRRKGIVFEQDLDEGQTFFCNYEKIKFEAEKLVEQSKADLPVAIYRPSMVVGDSLTGVTSSFNVIYEPLQMMLKGRLPYWPSNRKSIIDVVPIDYICKALLHFASIPEAVKGKTFHLTVGSGREINSRELRNLSYDFLNKNTSLIAKRPVCIPPSTMNGLALLFHKYGNKKHKLIARYWMTFASYTSTYKTFDNKEAMAFLEPAGIKAPRLESYLERLCNYALQQNFGAIPKSLPLYFPKNNSLAFS